MKKIDKTKKDYVTISINLRINGKIHRTKRRKLYARGWETYAYDLQDFARILFSYDKIFGGATYAYDGLLQEMERKLPSRNGETAESLFNKYWINMRETIQQEFDEMNAGGHRTPFADPGSYFEFMLSEQTNGFNESPMVVKQGFLYWLHHYCLKGSIEEYQNDLELVPQSVKKVVDRGMKDAPVVK